jgi:hypothetical protein
MNIHTSYETKIEYAKCEANTNANALQIRRNPIIQLI